MCMLNSVAVRHAWITVMETKILRLFTGLLQFSHTTLQRCNTPNPEGKTVEELNGAVCMPV